MKKLFLFLTLLSTIMVVDAKNPKSTDLDLRIGTYNIWSHQARASRIRKNNAAPERNWDTSKKAVVQHIIDLDCDVMALQEVTNVCYEDLTNLLKKGKGKKYAIWWENIYPEGMRQIGSAVLYNKKRFSLSQQKIYYFSPTPEVRSKGWDEKRLFRASLATVITEKASGRKFLLFAAHGPLAKEAKVHAGRLLVEFDKNYNTEALPTIALGDMNARPDGAFRKAMCAHYEDLLALAKEDYSAIEKLIPKLIVSARAQWYSESKPYGFDLIERKLGGLLARTTSCKQRIIDYVNGKIDSIPELSEEILPYGVKGESMLAAGEKILSTGAVM